MIASTKSGMIAVKSNPGTLFNKKKLSEYQISANKLLSKANAPTDYTSMPAGTIKDKDDSKNDVSSIAKSQASEVDRDGFSKATKRKDRNDRGQMLDSDGFAMLDLEDCDINEMTLEEKILCGFFSSRPPNKETYPSSMLNRPNPPNGQDYSYP